MGSSVRSAIHATPDNSLPAATQRMAKAGLPAASELSGLIKDTAKRVHGKQATAAAVVGKAESNFSRDVDSGALRTSDLAQLGPAFLAELGKGLVERYAPLNTPAARVRELARQQERIARELEQLSEFIA